MLLALFACTNPDNDSKSPADSDGTADVAPTVSITSPADAAVLEPDTELTLVALVTDEDVAGLTISWSSSVAGPLTGAESRNDTSIALAVAGLPSGAQTLYISATDGAGQKAEDSVDVEVSQPGVAPTVTFSSPADGAEIVVGVPTTLSLVVSDDEDADAVTLDWIGATGDSHPSGGLASATVTPSSLGAVVMEVEGTDGDGLTATASRSFTAVAPDLDGDGHTDIAWGGDDCDDADGLVFPGAGEVCDGDDDDCDALVDQDDPDLDADTLIESWADADGDGWGDAAEPAIGCEAEEGWVLDNTDCDDTDASVSPAMVELCDDADVDEDCNGLADDEDAAAEGGSSGYLDEDDDGYGTGAPVSSCDTPVGALVDGDCDDADDTINPGAAELCDAADVDEDCDGTADDADADVTGTGTWYTDADGDGVGGTAVTACDAPADAAATSGDCDDTNADIFPGKPDLCDDGIDDDCADGDAACPTEDVLIATGGGTNLFMGVHVLVADVDLDGADDVVATNLTSSSSYSKNGSVWVIDGPIREDRFGSTEAKYTGSHEERLGNDVAADGDLDGDGVGDLLLLAPYSADPTTGAEYVGAIYQVSAPFDGGAVADVATTTWWGAGVGDGAQSMGLGDADGDGNSDLLAGLLTGDVVLDLGPLHTGDAVFEDEADVVFEQAVSGDGSGEATLIDPDLDGDGRKDVVASAPNSDLGDKNGGSVHAWWSWSTGTESFSSSDATWIGPYYEYAGQVLASGGDIDGDGQDDLVIASENGGGVSGDDMGSAWVVSGADAGGDLNLVDSWMIVVGEKGRMLGSAAHVADLDDDGVAEVILGLPGWGDEWSTTFRFEAGAAVVFHGAAGTFTIDDADTTYDGDDAGGYYGCSLGAGDVDYDGTVDVVVGAYVNGTYAAQDGLVQFILGGH